VLLLLLGVALTNGLLADLRWPGAVVAALLVLVVRPLTAWLCLLPGSRGARDLPGDNELGPRERVVVAVFGVRGIGSVYYLAYATGVADFGDPRPLWSTVAFAIVLSVVLHGVSVTPAMDWLERRREEEQRQVSPR
jgi:NhaP-type Na+/H+ or K+/H+ antiporter